MQVAKFPTSEDFGGMNAAYLAALDEHFSYIETATEDFLKLLERTPEATHKAEWVDAGGDVNVMYVEIDDMSEDARKAIINNLVGYATQAGNRIVRVCHGRMDVGHGLRWYFFCGLE